jgi:hypothetical protein
MSLTSQSKVAQAAPVTPYLELQKRLSIVDKTVAPINFQALTLSRGKLRCEFLGPFLMICIF